MSSLNTAGQKNKVLFDFLSKVGLKAFYPNKLTLWSLLEINKPSKGDEAPSSVEGIPLCFLKKLLKINAECWSCTQLSNSDEENNDLFDIYTAHDSADNKVNPLDLITALFLCADSLLQQEMALKMSMCQFSVPLLLPQSNTSQCTLMLWALSDIVKEWRPHDLSESKGFVEDNIIQADIPFYSFVRLKNCSLSKSQVLNQVLSRGQQNHNMFIHREMDGGALKREIANGLVEVSWYLPCGRENLDIFPEPTAFANLRGDISESLAQFSFLYQVSTATFVFLDRIEENERKILNSLQDVKSKLFFVINRKEGAAEEDIESFKTTLKELDLPKDRVKVKDLRVNVAQFSTKLCSTIKTSLLHVKAPQSIVHMRDKAVELGLSVDESKTDKAKIEAKKIIDGIGVRSIPDYKKQQLPLQGDNWKRLSQLEKKECRIKDVSVISLEEHKCQIQVEKQKIWEKQKQQKLSKGMRQFIEALSISEKEERDFFLKVMKIMLNKCSRKNLTVLRNQFKEQCKGNNTKRIAELDQALLDSSLGIEHYMREMALIYEVSMQSQVSTEAVSHLPGVVAEMLLDGYPLELLDGDASNIPERWVSAVLMELHKKVGEKSRLLVMTVLGVQSSGKSTLLNTMFGVQFPVSSGRCTRGAFMLFLKVGEDMKSDLNFDFILLIDTEGLKSPELAQLEESYEHDNQLATFVIGLSDVTIINIAMENATEMKDVLQITAHAFLRMKHIGKKPVCHFVHQNVAGVSAHTKNMTERKHLLDQLNEMTQIAAEMEKQPFIKAFTDVLDYDIEKNNWTIPGLWHGTPPMAPVNTGYSEAVADFKTNLLMTVKRDTGDQVLQIPEFLEWMRSLWKAVKYENFIFSFRNTLVAHAYDNLCKEFSQWEWEFKKVIISLQTAAELEILNADSESLENWSSMVATKKSEVSQETDSQETKMKGKLSDYYKRKDRHVNLIEKYKTDFLNSIRSLANDIKCSTYTKLDCALEVKKGSQKVQDIQRQYRGVIEEQVIQLLRGCRDSTLSDDQLTKEFEDMWAKATGNVCCLEERNITACVLNQLRNNLTNHIVNEKLQNNEDLKNAGNSCFKIKSDHMDFFKRKINYFWREERKADLQTFAQSAIENSKRFVLDKTKTYEDYQDSFTKDLLDEIDKSLKQNHKRFKTNTQFEIDLKLHICGIASREFLKMHQRFVAKNDSRAHLEKYKTQYLSDFLDLYKQKDHCQRKATDFVRCCIKPAVEEYIRRALGIDIVDEILTSGMSIEYSSRSFFQYNIQEELLETEDFDKFVKYIFKYEIYVKDWIFQHILQKMLVDKTLSKLKKKILQFIVKKIGKATEWASKGEDGVLLPDNQESITELINNMRIYLNKDISLSVEAEKATLFQIQSTCHPFTKNLLESLSDLEKQLQEEFSDSEDITETLNGLQIKPQDELFKRVFGCGQQCPFCKVPCEAGGKDHEKHHASVHRPQGLGRMRIISSQKLHETLCTTDVHGERKFQNEDTKWKYHPYKEYTTYYPDWHIPPDNTIQASDYWKYVLVKYNDRFAQEFQAKPADVPEAWKSITKEMALKGLKDAFNIK